MLISIMRKDGKNGGDSGNEGKDKSDKKVVRCTEPPKRGNQEVRSLLGLRSQLIRRMIRNLNSATTVQDKKFVIKWALENGLVKRSGTPNVDGWTDEYTEMVYDALQKRAINGSMVKYEYYSKLGGTTFSAKLAIHLRSKMRNVLSPKEVAKRLAEERSSTTSKE